ncbi:helix-turn-helix domain-containing protein [Sporomusa sphaeroides]|uniref:helix-turn-helix domain-containing protein n=1 Tax=Sporomusa sphaeroides TaxID=47679 RepID=UPI0031586C14
MEESLVQIKRKRINCIIPIWPLQEEREISLAAKGLLCLLLSFPDGWEIRMNDIISRSSNGRDSTRNAIKELLKAGYMERSYIRDRGMLLGSRYIVYDEPIRPP